MHRSVIQYIAYIKLKHDEILAMNSWEALSELLLTKILKLVLAESVF